MWIVYVLVWGAVAIFGLSAVYALVWAVRTRQMQDLPAGAASIFDDEEPVGVATDAFTNRSPATLHQAGGDR
ncbi:MAG: cbb3-type cytochrome oxidase assembly protein CcoS [bacterium]|nr:cbb3-type cytochrome oxidase assembly protein CcoS [bacterium]